MLRGTLFVVAAASGTGKTSLVAALVKQLSNVVISVSHTTRAKRESEEDGVNYHFVTEQQFEGMVEQADFLEFARVFDRSYGTSQTWVEEHLAAGKDVILEIDWQGAEQVRKIVPDSVGIFILPPSLETLKERLHHRGQDDEATISRRLAEAQHEISHCPEFDYLVVNDDFDIAVNELQAILQSKRLQIPRQLDTKSQLLNDLLAKS